MANISQILADVELAEEVAVQVSTDLAELESGQAASSSFEATLFGHKQNVTISFSPVVAAPEAEIHTEPPAAS